MQDIKLILKRIEEDLDKLDSLLTNNLNSKGVDNSSNKKFLDSEVLNKISYNLNKMDKIIKELDENS